VKLKRFAVVISQLPPGEVESLRLDLTRAAISASRRGDGRTITIESRSNTVFSVEDVLDVIASWIEKRPERLGTASITVQRAASEDRRLRRFRGIPLLVPHRRYAAPSSIRTP
jgi:hypothetical protein